MILWKTVGTIIHNALSTIDHVSNHRVRPSILADIVYCDEGVMNNGPYSQFQGFQVGRLLARSITLITL